MEPSPEPPAPGLPPDAISHGMCPECRVRVEREIDVDAGNGAGAETPGPASHDTVDSHHRRPGVTIDERRALLASDAWEE